MEGGFLLDIIVGKSSSVLELFTREDQALLIRGDPLLLLDLLLDIFDTVAGNIVYASQSQTDLTDRVMEELEKGTKTAK